MNRWIAPSVSGLIFVAELPDKTALASPLLGVRYPSPLVFSVVAGARGQPGRRGRDGGLGRFHLVQALG